MNEERSVRRWGPLLRRAACAVASLGIMAALAVPTTVSIVAPSNGESNFGTRAFVVELSSRCAPGETTQPRFEGSILIRLNGSAWRSFQTTSPTLTCQAGTGRATAFPPHLLPLGTQVVTVEYSGDSFHEAAGAPSATLTVKPQFTGTSFPSEATVKVGLAFPELDTGRSADCRFTAASFTPQENIPQAPPAGREFPYGLFQFDIGACDMRDEFSLPFRLSQRLSLLFPQDIPAGAELWAYGPRTSSFPEWYPVAAVISGRYLDVVLTDGDAPDLSPLGDNILRGVIALAIPKVAHATLRPEGLWWAGTRENGWGLSIARSGDILFNALFVYGDDGAPQWVVMPGGQWDAGFTSFTGDLFVPRGTWFGDYNASQLNVGPAVGSATLAFAGNDAATLTYTLRGVAGTKQVQRQTFAASTPIAPGSYGGLWWGGPAQTGWGLSIAQQGETLFNVWFTYDAAGNVTWYVMPGGRWVTPRIYSGVLYRTQGPPWAGRPYDVSRLQVRAVGSMTVAFDSDDGAYLTYVVDGVEQTRAITRQPF